MLDLTKDEVPQTDQEFSRLKEETIHDVRATDEQVQVDKEEYDKVNKFYSVGALLLSDFMALYE